MKNTKKKNSDELPITYRGTMDVEGIEVKKRAWIQPLYIVNKKIDDKVSSTRHSQERAFSEENIKHKW